MQKPSDDSINLISLRPALSELERFVKWYYNERIGGRTADVGFTILIASSPKQCGYFGEARWSTKEGEVVHEMVITSERLRSDPLDILGTVAHETVHLWNCDQEFKDCSKSGRHNKRFRESAEDCGLVVEKGTKGWSTTTLSPELKRVIEQEFQPDYEAFKLFRLIPPAKESRVSTKAYTCGCTKVRVSLKQTLVATCDLCNNQFTEVLPDA